MLWKESNRKDAQELIAWLLQQKPAPNSWPVNWSVSIASVELAASSSDSALNHDRVKEVLDRMYVAGQSTVADFETQYSRLQREATLADRTGQADWTFYIPLELRVTKGTRPKTLKFVGRSVSLYPVDSALRELPDNPAISWSRRNYVVDEMKMAGNHWLQQRISTWGFPQNTSQRKG